MVGWPLALVAPVLALTACVPRATFHAAAYAVYAAVLADIRYEVRVARETHEALPCDSALMSLCDAGRFLRRIGMPCGITLPEAPPPWCSRDSRHRPAR